MFAGAGVLTVAAAVALWQSIDAYRWRDWRRFWIATVLVPLLSTVVYASIWEGSRHPTINFWGNLWLGPDWICENPGIIPLITRRSSTRGLPRVSVGRYGTRRSNCWSVSQKCTRSISGLPSETLNHKSARAGIRFMGPELGGTLERFFWNGPRKGAFRSTPLSRGPRWNGTRVSGAAGASREVWILPSTASSKAGATSISVRRYRQSAYTFPSVSRLCTAVNANRQL
jgi:hypothetical protein